MFNVSMACFSKRGYAVRSEGSTRPPPSFLNGSIARGDVQSQRGDKEHCKRVTPITKERRALEGSMGERGSQRADEASGGYTGVNHAHRAHRGSARKWAGWPRRAQPGKFRIVIFE